MVVAAGVAWTCGGPDPYRFWPVQDAHNFIPTGTDAYVHVRVYIYIYIYIYLVQVDNIDPLPYVYEVATNLAVPAQPTSGLMNVYN